MITYSEVRSKGAVVLSLVVIVFRTGVSSSSKAEGLKRVDVVATPSTANDVEAISAGRNVLASSFKEGELLRNLNKVDAVVRVLDVNDELLDGLKAGRRYIDAKMR